MRKKYFTEEERKQAKREWDLQYRLKNREALLEKKRQYYENNKERHSEVMAEHYKNNSEKYKEKAIQWKKDNRSRHNASCMLRHTAKIQRTPKWLSSDDLWLIEQAYELASLREQTCGGKWHVDHIVPLQGKNVSGLHVPWNLQVIPASVNCSKRNSWHDGSN